MENSRVLRMALWIALAFSTLVSIAIICVATDTSLFALDAWNSTWNDEQRYYRTVLQMREVGHPSGMAGYNEVPAPRPSYGPYSVFVYSLYYLGSFLTGVANHNFIYIINMSFAVISCLLIILVLRPNAREAALCAVFFAFQFIIARYACSGMTETSYVLFASVFACCALYVSKHAYEEGKDARIVVALLVMMAACGFWGLMRPYVLAFMLVPWLMIAWGGMGFSRGKRIVLFVIGIVVAVASIMGYMYISKYYVTPYFNGPTIANNFFGRIAAALPGLPAKNLECVLYSGAKLVKLKWQGIMVFTFAFAWVVLAVLFVRAMKREDKTTAALFFALLLAGFAIFEAHMMIYKYQQMHRTMMCVDVIYVLVIIWHGAKLFASHAPSSRVLLVAAVSLLCTACLFSARGDFPLPQATDVRSSSYSASLQEELEKAFPKSEDMWDNTIAHPVEGSDIFIYFNVPSYMNLNTVKMNYLESAMKEGSFKSKYVSIPDTMKVNAKMKRRYPIVYEGAGHIVYDVRKKL